MGHEQIEKILAKQRAYAESDVWLSEGLPLSRFLWGAQPGAAPIVVDWVRAWADAAYRGFERPQPILILQGPYGTGKTVMAEGIARYLVCNIARKFTSAQYVLWQDYILDQLNGQHLDVGWYTKRLIVLDDFDSGVRPVPRSMDTWMLNLMTARIKSRVMQYKLPLILTMNRDLESPTMVKYLSTNSLGESNDDTVRYAYQVISTIRRNVFGIVEFESNRVDDRQLHTLPAQAERENDMEALGFEFLLKADLFDEVKY